MQTRNPKLDIVIPAAGLGYRMKLYGPKALISLDGENVLNRQVRLLRQAYPYARFIVVTGFQYKKYRRQFKNSDIKFVCNRSYANTNVAKSIAMGLNRTRKTAPVMIVYGDLVFNEETIKNIPLDRSCVLVDRSQTRNEEVGINHIDGIVNCLSYGLPDKWAHICLLCPKDKLKFMKFARQPHSDKHFGYEIINRIIDSGSVIHSYEPPNMRLVEIDTVKDIDKARSITSANLV